MKLISILIFFVLFTLLSCGQNTSFKQVNSEQFRELTKNNSKVLLDVRTPSEFKNGHIANSGQLNFYTLSFRKKLLLLPKNQSILLYCNTGYRSEKAAKYLVANGYKNVYNLEHGIMEWELKNFPVVVDPNAKADTNNKMEFAEFSKLIESSVPVFIDFYAPWCGPCRTMMPFIDSLKVDYYKQINVVKINVDASKKLVKELKIGGVPYLAIYKNGEQLYEKNGALTRSELEGVFKANIVNSAN